MLLYLPAGASCLTLKLYCHTFRVGLSCSTNVVLKSLRVFRNDLHFSTANFCLLLLPIASAELLLTGEFILDPKVVVLLIDIVSTLFMCFIIVVGWVDGSMLE